MIYRLQAEHFYKIKVKIKKLNIYLIKRNAFVIKTIDFNNGKSRKHIFVKFIKFF